MLTGGKNLTVEFIRNRITEIIMGKSESCRSLFHSFCIVFIVNRLAGAGTTLT